jgi:hypothetical protein
MDRIALLDSQMRPLTPIGAPENVSIVGARV